MRDGAEFGLLYGEHGAGAIEGRVADDVGQSSGGDNGVPVEGEGVALDDVGALVQGESRAGDAEGLAGFEVHLVVG